MKQDVRIGVLVLNYNGRRFLSPVFTALDFLRTDPRARVVLIDNASHDGSVAWCQKEFPWVITIANDDNYGWGEGYNRGIAQLQQSGFTFTHYLFLNNDTVPSPEWFEQLYKETNNSEPSVAEWGCRTVFSDRIVTETLFKEGKIFSDEKIKLLFLNAGTHFDILDSKDGPVIRSSPSSKRMGIFRKYIPAETIGYTLQFENNTRNDVLTHLKKGIQAYLLDEVKGVQLFRIQEGAEGQTQIRVPKLGKVLMYRSFPEYYPFIPHIQNSGIGLTPSFEGYDLQCYEPLDRPQNDRDFVGVCGVSKLVRVDAFEKLRGFDPQYFMYYEDLDFSLRLQKLGFRSVMVTGAVLQHHHGGSSNVRSKFFARQVAWSLLYFQWQHAKMFQKWCRLVSTILRARTEEDNGIYRSQQVNRFALTKFIRLFSGKPSTMHRLIQWAGGNIL